MNEIEDAVASGVHAGDQVGPGYRALRRNAGSEFMERSFAGELGEVGHLALLHELAEQLGIHAVDAEDDELVRGLVLPLTGSEKGTGGQQQGGQ